MFITFKNYLAKLLSQNLGQGSSQNLGQGSSQNLAPKDGRQDLVKMIVERGFPQKVGRQRWSKGFVKGLFGEIY